MKYHSERFEFLTSAHYLGQGQCLVGSLTGAVASQNVTEAFTKVGLVRMEIGLDVQTQKPALLKGLPPDQSRKRKLVIRPYDIGRRKLNG